MSERLIDSPKDPRVRRTRRLLQDSLSTLLEEKSFGDLSITDICRQADIARVTFYQHYDSKEALLLASVAEFFANLHQTVNQDALDQYLETGDMSALKSTRQMDLADPSQVRLIGVALQHIGAAVRKLVLASFLETYSQRETELDEKEIQILATFYIGGMLTLFEQFLSGQLTVSQSEVQVATLTFLRALRQEALKARDL
ncbi:MAG: TetR/AcrR family transcriptional regulator [Cyanobacteria bacterium P01_H01_bin.21]